MSRVPSKTMDPSEAIIVQMYINRIEETNNISRERLKNIAIRENKAKTEAVAKAERFARALVAVLDGVQDHELQGMTGLCEADCNEIARTRTEAAALVPVRL